MKKLLRQYGFNSDMQYYEMCLESFKNGQKEQAKEQFAAIPKAFRKSMVREMIIHWEVSDSVKQFFFDNL